MYFTVWFLYPTLWYREIVETQYIYCKGKKRYFTRRMIQTSSRHFATPFSLAGEDHSLVPLAKKHVFTNPIV